jgi:hypothetical protein
MVNAGDTDIGVGDFGEPIQFSADKATIQDVVPGDSEPPGLTFQLSKPKNSTFSLEPLLLKKREAISFSVLSTSKLDRLLVKARIKNGEVNVRPLPQGAVVVTPLLLPLVLFMASIMMIASIIAFISFYWIRVTRERTWLRILALPEEPRQE